MDCKTIDLATNKPNFSTSFSFTEYETNITCYALTKMVQDHAKVAGDIRRLTDNPSTTTIETNINERTKVFRDIIAIFDSGCIIGVYIMNQNNYIVEILSSTKEGLVELESLFSKYLSESNFYKSKCIKFTQKGIDFIDKPDTLFSDVVLQEDLFEQYKLNVIDFLCNEELHSIIKKRSIILHGPPGCGKTFLLSATFNYLTQVGVSCIFLSDDIFKKISIDTLFDFVSKFLCPAILTFEDIDLIGYDRSKGNSKVIGPLLSRLDGIQVHKNPLVIIATTNRFDELDNALTRPVRFDRRLKIDFPNTKEVEQLFQKIVGYPAPLDIIGEKKVTGAHVREIFNTVSLMSIQRKSDINDCIVKEATKTVLENFFIGQRSVGFHMENHDEENSSPPQTVPGGGHWEVKRSNSLK